MTKVIAVASGKGGVGKTTITANLSAAFADFGRNVVAMDANVTAANLCLHLGFSLKPNNIQDVLRGRVRLRDVLYEHSAGFSVIPAGVGVNDIDVSTKNISNLVLRLIGTTDYIIIDTPPTLNRETINVLATADQVVLVTNPELPAVTDCLKTLKVAESLGVEPVGVVLNRVLNKRYEMDRDVVEATMGVPIIGEIPEDIRVRYSVITKAPVVHSFPNSRASVHMKKVAADILGEHYEIPRYGLMDRIQRIIDSIKE